MLNVTHALTEPEAPSAGGECLIAISRPRGCLMVPVASTLLILSCHACNVTITWVVSLHHGCRLHMHAAPGGHNLQARSKHWQLRTCDLVVFLCQVCYIAGNTSTQIEEIHLAHAHASPKSAITHWHNNIYINDNIVQHVAGHSKRASCQ